MPVILTIDTEQRLTITAGTGAVTDARVSEEIAAKLIVDPLSEKPICRAVVVSERTGPMKAILDFISRTRRANRRIAAFPDLASAEKWVFTARVELPPE